MRHRWNDKWPFWGPRMGLVLLFFTAVFLGVHFLKKQPETITIGSKNFTEQIILAEIIAALIENNPVGKTMRVEKKLNLGGTFVCFTALKNDKLDCYVEYTGTGESYHHLVTIRKQVMDRIMQAIKCFNIIF